MAEDADDGRRRPRSALRTGGRRSGQAQNHTRDSSNARLDRAGGSARGFHAKAPPGPSDHVPTCGERGPRGQAIQMRGATRERAPHTSPTADPSRRHDSSHVDRMPEHPAGEYPPGSDPLGRFTAAPGLGPRIQGAHKVVQSPSITRGYGAGHWHHALSILPVAGGGLMARPLAVKHGRGPRHGGRKRFSHKTGVETQAHARSVSVGV